MFYDAGFAAPRRCDYDIAEPQDYAITLDDADYAPLVIIRC